MRLARICIGLSLFVAMGQACGGDDAPGTGSSAGSGGTSGGADASSGGASGRGGAGNAGTGGVGATGGTAGRGATSGSGGAFDGGGTSGAGSAGAPTDGGGGRAGTGTGGAPMDGSSGASGSGGATIDSGGDLVGTDGTTGGASGSGGAGAGGASTDGASGASGTEAGGMTDGGGVGDADGTSTDASRDSDVNCSDASADKRVFVSSVLYTGNLGGLAGADAKCQGLADSAGLCGTFKAWLSDATADAAARLTHATGNYVRTDGQIVASGWAGLVSGTIQHAINLTEANGAAPVGTVKCGGTTITPVWTGSTTAGANVMNGSCSNWASSGSGPGGIFGNADATNAAWTAMCQIVAVCQSTAAIYCVEQ